MAWRLARNHRSLRFASPAQDLMLATPMARWFAVPALILALPVAVSAQSRFVADIRGEFEEPLSGVRITILHQNGGGLVGECQTDGLGGCVVAVAPSRHYIIRASLMDYIPQQTEMLAPAGDIGVLWTLGRVPSAPRPQRDPSAAVVEGLILGSVRSLTDEPVAFIGVEALSGGNIRGASVTGEDGSFRISLPPGTYTVRSDPTMRGAGRIFETAVYGAPVTVTSSHVTGPVVLYPGSSTLPTVNVIVTTVAGRPIDGAEVIDWSHGRASSSGVGFTSMNGTRMSGPNGAVSILALPGTITIVATARVDGEDLAGMATAEVGSAPLDLVVTLGRAAEVRGRVEFVGRERPLLNGDGLRITPDPGRGRAGVLSTDTNGLVGADGEFVLKGLVGERCLLLRGGPPRGWRLVEITHYGQPLGDKPILFRPGEKVTGIVFRVEPTTEDLSPPPPCVVTNP
jgi:hypothetical protein